MAYPYSYGGYPNYFAPPAPDQLTQLRQNAYQQPIMQQNAQQMPQQMPQQTQNSNGIIWVQGEEGAKAFMVGAGNTVLLMDSDGSSFYLKSADVNGMPQPLRIFDYTERAQAPRAPLETKREEYVTREEFNALEAKIEAIAAKEPTRARKTTKEGGDE